MEMHDLTGRLVYTANLDGSAHGVPVIDVDRLAPGEYTLNVHHQGGKSVRRVVRY
jgi:hypothetical protein